MRNPTACAALFALLTLTGACSDRRSARGGADVGSLQTALVGRGESGALYRLRYASFDVTGRDGDAGAVRFQESWWSEEDRDASALVREVPAGAYSVRLQPGWSMERLDGDGRYRWVEATLTSDPTQHAHVTPGGIGLVVYDFEVDGEPVDFDSLLGVLIRVHERTDGGVDGGQPEPDQDAGQGNCYWADGGVYCQ